MNLKEFLEGAVKESPVKVLRMAEKLIELDAIEQYFNLMYGIEFDIQVKIVKPKVGRFYGKGVIDNLF